MKMMKIGKRMVEYCKRDNVAADDAAVVVHANRII